MYAFELVGRTLVLDGDEAKAAGELPALPAEVALTFELQPPEAFGVERNPEQGKPRSRTVNAKKDGTLWFNANNGEWWSRGPVIERVTGSIVIGDGQMTLDGNLLTVHRRCSDVHDLDGMIGAVRHLTCAGLSARIADAPFISRVFGTVGGVPVRWEIRGWQERGLPNHDRLKSGERWAQFEATVKAMALFNAAGNRRLMAGFDYYLQAKRLLHSGNGP